MRTTLEQQPGYKDLRGTSVTTVIKTGDHLDHYRIDGLVSRTALASTFRGTDVDSGRKVAIKLPHGEAEENPSIHERFCREEKIGKKLNHPGVVKVLPDEWRSGVYLVTEWVEGRPLREILNREGRLEPARATRIAVSICKALDYVHSHGVVHRDLKPENILVDFGDQITLIDFGIAVAGGAQRMALTTSSDALLGTPDYISPEEVKGIRGNARSDLYALGVILYEMLADRTPFEGCNPLVVMNERLINDPAPIRAIVPEISCGMEEVLHRALQRDPRRRYASADEFARDLERQAPGTAGGHAELRPAWGV
jgi:serine/threonine-protein kinase